MTDQRVESQEQQRFDAERLKQSERTIDNLKRLYAVLFALSFGAVVKAGFEKLSAFAEPTVAPHWLAFGVHTELTLAFMVTAGLFYYQGDRFLDVAYAKAPLRDVGPMEFGVDYLTNVLTMMPFFLMANALSNDLINRFGFLWFAVSYVVLISLGLGLLVVRDIWWAIRSIAHARELHALQSFWMIMNSLAVTAVVIAYHHFQKFDACPARVGSGVPWFLFALGGLILLRDGVDFMHGWAVLYPVNPKSKQGQLLPAMKWLASDKGHILGQILGYLCIVTLIFVLAGTGLWDLSALARACVSQTP